MNPRDITQGESARSSPPLGGSNHAAAPSPIGSVLICDVCGLTSQNVSDYPDTHTEACACPVCGCKPAHGTVRCGQRLSGTEWCACVRGASPIGSVAELQLAATEWHEAMNAPMFDGPRVSRANDALHAAVDALSEAVRNEKSAAGLNPLPRDLSADEAARIDAAGGPLTVEEAIKAFSDKWVVVNSDWQALEVRTDLKMIERAVRNEVASGLNDSLQPESESDLRHVPASNEASTHEVGREACAVCGHPKYISPTLPREPRYETHQVATFSGDLPFSRGIAPIRVNICYGGCLHEPGAPNYHAYEEASR